MDFDLAEIRDFLAGHAPFDRLPPEALDALPRQLSVRYLRRGTPVPPPDADGPYLYVVRQGALEMRDADGDLVDKLGEGDSCPLACDADLRSTFSAVAVEDSLLYLLPCNQLLALRQTQADFDRYFDASAARRLQFALSVLRRRMDSRAGGGLTALAVGSLMRGDPVCVPPGASIRSAAQLMSERRVSSVLIMDGTRLAGIVTDRDLRSRCLAAGRDSSEPIGSIMTAGVQTIGPDAPAFDALVRMTRLNVHHLPVVDRTGVVGVLSATDLVRHEGANPIYLVAEIHKAATAGQLAQIGVRLPQLQVQLAQAGASARQVGETISTINDALTVRLLQLAEEQLGAAPVPYAWMTGGSHARREQTSHSDQDNALIIDDSGGDAHQAYFAALAGFVNDGLNACGFVYCPGKVMACNPEWRQPLHRWQRYFSGWIQQPEPMALMLSSVFFDLRVVHGDGALYRRLQQENLRQTRANSIFLAHMAANALTHRPPLGFFRRLVVERGGAHADTLDLKHRGVVPVVDLARIYALALGIEEINTAERLRAAAGSAVLSQDGARNLEDALELIATLRLLHQARQLRQGRAADNFLAPETLSTLERNHLKDAFGVIAGMQRALEQHFGASRLR